jgi:uncharacterized membrane protein YagU involved in acid resistance
MTFVRMVGIAAGMFICVLKKGIYVKLPEKVQVKGDHEDIAEAYFSPTAKIDDEGLKARS